VSLDIIASKTDVFGSASTESLIKASISLKPDRLKFLVVIGFLKYFW